MAHALHGIESRRTCKTLNKYMSSNSITKQLFLILVNQQTVAHQCIVTRFDYAIMVYVRQQKYSCTRQADKSRHDRKQYFQ